MSKELIEELQATLNDGSQYLTTNIAKELLNRAICELQRLSTTTSDGWHYPYPKPLKEGVYRVRYATDGKEGYQYWNGKAFNCWNSTPEEALEGYNTDRSYESSYQNNFWKEVE